jgi:hypothetical protein
LQQAEANRVRLMQRSEPDEMLGKRPIGNIEFDSEVRQYAPQVSAVTYYFNPISSLALLCEM